MGMARGEGFRKKWSLVIAHGSFLVFHGCMRKALLVIAQDGFQDRELAGTRDALEAKGFAVVLASTACGPCRGKFGSTERALIALKDVKVADYDRVGFIGGPGAATLASDAEALRIAHETARLGKPLGAICIAPTILAKAHVLEGKKATVWDDGQGTQIRMLEQYGAQVTGHTVTVDGNTVTANGPEAAEEFGKAFASL